jgi:membrane dipeptidase
MKKFLKTLAWLLALSLISAGFYFFKVFPPKADANMNLVLKHEPYKISDEAQGLHANMRVADLHADTLLWKRNPAKRHTYGQTDLPRFREGQVALQVFSTVTFVPGNMNTTANKMEKDQMRLLTVLQSWPRRTWNSIFERAVYQAERLHKLQESSNGSFVIAKTKSDLRDAMSRRTDNNDIIVGVLATEGAHPLEGDITNLGKLYDAGFRMIGLQHFFDNKLGGSLHGVSKSGLTPFGKEVVRKIVDKGMMIDVAHSSIETVEDVLALTDAPIVISHTGILSLCNHEKRNIPDKLLQQIADRGGLIGVGYWETAVCDTTPDGIAKMLIHGAGKFGVDHIALGSDFDGSVTTSLDTSELVAITDALLRQGMVEPDIRKVMGENQIAYFLKHLPGE